MEDVVLEVPTDGWNLNAEQVTKIIKRKKNWSAPGPDRIANFWWKKATFLHKEIAACFLQATAQLEDLQFPLWFSEGKTTLIPKPGEFRSDNQRPITCLNNLYKWYTSCLLAQANQHIELLPKRPKAKRSLLQCVLRKDCRKVMRCVLCCSYCA